MKPVEHVRLDQLYDITQIFTLNLKSPAEIAQQSQHYAGNHGFLNVDAAVRVQPRHYDVKERRSALGKNPKLSVPTLQ